MVFFETGKLWSSWWIVVIVMMMKMMMIHFEMFHAFVEIRCDCVLWVRRWNGSCKQGRLWKIFLSSYQGSISTMHSHMSIQITRLWESAGEEVVLIKFFLYFKIIWEFQDFITHRNKHNLHWYGFSPLCIRKCLVSVELSEKAFLHALQRYGRSPECVRMWVVTLELWEKRRSQIGQRNGFWPVCVRTWAVRLAACEKLLLQSPHLYVSNTKN